jgi:endonuclease/exonuclease/phosphatase family metal-dependent hydrolase
MRAGRWRALRLALRAGVAAALASALLLTALQRSDLGNTWWVELSRYAPYNWILVPCALALLAALGLGRTWVLAGAATLAAVLVLQMDLQWRFDLGAAQPGQRLRLMTYNIKAADAVGRRGGVQVLAREIAGHAPDVVLAQDANGLLVQRDGPALTQGPLWGLQHVYALGQYIVASRFPIQACDTGRIDTREEPHRYLRCTIEVNGLALGVVTVHFQTPRNGLMAVRREGLGAIDDWQRNYADRLLQAHALAHDLPDRPRPLVVAGDFNAVDASPVMHMVRASGLRDAFAAAGRGWGFTHGHAERSIGSFLRIDHILVSPDLGVADSFVGGSRASAHRPVIADLILPEPIPR